MIRLEIKLTWQMIQNIGELRAKIIQEIAEITPEDVRTEVYNRGYETGRADGYEDGMEEGVAEGKQFQNANDKGMANVKRRRLSVNEELDLYLQQLNEASEKRGPRFGPDPL